MPRGSLRKDVAELLGASTGWRLEPRTTPGASPLWCFLSEGKVELSVSVEGSAILLYVMDSDEETRFSSFDIFVAWLGEHWPETLQSPPPKADKKTRARSFFEWN